MIIWTYALPLIDRKIQNMAWYICIFFIINLNKTENLMQMMILLDKSKWKRNNITEMVTCWQDIFRNYKEWFTLKQEASDSPIYGLQEKKKHYRLTNWSQMDKQTNDI